MSALAARDRVRARLAQRLAEARARTDRLFDALDEASLYERPIAERHRLVFYLGHLEAFDANLVRGHDPLLGRTGPGFDRLFAFGIDPPPGRLPADPPEAWPALAEVRRYVATARDRIDSWVASVDPGCSGPWAHGSEHCDPACLLGVAIEHRLMHAETLAYMLHRLPPGRLRLPPDAADEAAAGEAAAPAHEPLPVPAGAVQVGRRRDDAAAFGWDNEYAQQYIELPAFEIDRCMVANGQLLRFVEAGGYADPEWWTADDWDWIRSEGIAYPPFWRRDGRSWRWRAMGREIALPLRWPAYVSQAEAAAYARWAGRALPSEAQWLRAAVGTAMRPDLRLGEAYAEAAGPVAGNFDFRRWDPEPVDAPGPCSDFGVAGLYGNGWEWTASTFGPAPGFESFAPYRGYSQDFFDAAHVVLKGGSPQTAACMMRPSFRNWFRPRYRHVYAGFRCVSAPAR